MTVKHACTDAVRRLLEEMAAGQTVIRVHNTHRAGDYSWWAGDRPVTGPVHRAFTNGYVRVVENDEDQVVLTGLGRKVALTPKLVRAVSKSSGFGGEARNRALREKERFRLAPGGSL